MSVDEQCGRGDGAVCGAGGGASICRYLGGTGGVRGVWAGGGDGGQGLIHTGDIPDIQSHDTFFTSYPMTAKKRCRGDPAMANKYDHLPSASMELAMLGCCGFRLIGIGRTRIVFTAELQPTAAPDGVQSKALRPFGAVFQRLLIAVAE